MCSIFCYKALNRMLLLSNYVVSLRILTTFGLKSSVTSTKGVRTLINEYIYNSIASIQATLLSSNDSFICHVFGFLCVGITCCNITSQYLVWDDIRADITSKVYLLIYLWDVIHLECMLSCLCSLHVEFHQNRLLNIL